VVAARAKEAADPVDLAVGDVGIAGKEGGDLLSVGAQRARLLAVGVSLH
jgi:hypothetical protein